MSLKDQLFAFESDALWLDGTELILLRDAVKCWPAGAPDVIHGETAFEIVYQMPDERFIRVYAPGCKRCRELKGLFGTRKIWATKDPLEIGYFSGWPLILFFRDNNQPLPEPLAKMVDEAKAASERVRPLDELLRIEFPPGPPGSTAHRVDWRWLINQLQKLLVDVVNELRTGTNKYYSSESIHWLCRLLSHQYEVDVAHWWGPKGTIPPATVDILELPWPREYAGAVTAIGAFRNRAFKLLRICDRQHRTPGAPAGYPNDAEREFVWKQLIGMLPDLESDVAAFLKAVPDEHPAPPDLGELPIFIDQGSTWKVAFRGHEESIPNRIGLRYISELVSKSERPVSARVLIGLTNSRVRHDANSFQAIVEPEVEQEYRDRLIQIEGEVEEAEAVGNIDIVAQLRNEQESIASELLRARDGNGNSRQMKNGAEQNRVSVTNAINRAMTEIGKKMPDLKRHLEMSIDCGKECVYRPSKIPN